MPESALIELEKSIKWYAYRLTYQTPDIFDDVCQEMRLVIWQLPEGMENGYYMRAARNKAIDYLKSKRRNYSYNDQFEHIPFDLLKENDFEFDTTLDLHYPGKRIRPKLYMIL